MSVREYRSSVFSMLMEEKENALEVYNALNHTNYTNPDDVEIKLLRNSIALSMRNDASFLLDAHFNLYEHQSTFNRNMPLRTLFYYSDLMREYVSSKDLLGTRLVKIPTPHFKVFYNGHDYHQDRYLLKLSDAFIQETDDPDIEMHCEVININPGHNLDFMEKCHVLREYTEFVEKVAKKKATTDNIEVAVSTAIDECLEEHILYAFLLKRGKEVLENMVIDMTWEHREGIIRAEERAEGKLEGKQEGILEEKATKISKKLQKNKTLEQIADELEEEIPKIKPLYDIAVTEAPTYDVNRIVRRYLEQQNGE